MARSGGLCWATIVLLVCRFDVFFDVLNVFAAQITSLRLCVGLGPTWSCSFGGWLWSGTRRWRLCPGSCGFKLHYTLSTSRPTVQLSNLADFYVYMTSISLSKINLYHGFKLWSRSARFSDDLQIWNGQIVQNGVLFHPSSCEDCFPSWNSQFRL